MGPKTKGKGTKKAWREAVGPSVSAESTQPKVWQQKEVFLPETEVTDERSTEEDMASDEDAQSRASSSRAANEAVQHVLSSRWRNLGWFLPRPSWALRSLQWDVPQQAESS